MVITNGDVILVALNGNSRINDEQLEAVSGGCGVTLISSYVLIIFGDQIGRRFLLDYSSCICT